MDSAPASDGPRLTLPPTPCGRRPSCWSSGHFAVGKTTFVGTLSEIRPLRTEETMTQAGALVDDLAGIDGQDAPPRWPWTSAGSRSATTWCCTSSARPGSSASPGSGRT